MRLLSALVAVLLALGVAGCGTSSSPGASGRPSAVCHTWEHLKAHPGSDPLGALNDLAQRAREPKQTLLLVAVASDLLHGRDTYVDQLRVDRYCAAL